MLAGLQTVPQTQADWDRFAYWNYDCNNQIRAAILAQKNIRLFEYQLYPIDFNRLDIFMNNNQQAHIDFTNALGLQSSDLLNVDLKDAAQRAGFIWINYMELLNACQSLMIGP